MKSNWKIDREHSELRFETDYLVISKISGFITSFDASFQTDETGFKNITQVRLVADVNSLNTHNPMRDAHLKNDQYFDASRYSDILFTSTEIIQGSDGLPGEFLSAEKKEFAIKGILTIKGITKPVIMHGSFGGAILEAGRKIRAGFTISTTINRIDFGVGDVIHTKGGQLLLGEDVVITANCQFIREAA
ncbi:YceI family protein [Mucilaginibacter sp. SG564]|uniref:YceI family protein n=1 Tax=Mucilaginibacter sp. SG564 TaxID=2587022 RepID=UPI0015535490|nr:YceI family protein [Mucilaginibacter sp. SG564]NOW96061.1 polyisoprenoid-binding protein YceI [Mucilaginibacter sp. SG564]